jgi:hypothetical protein
MRDIYTDWKQKIYKASIKFLDVYVHDKWGEEWFSMKTYVRLAEDFVSCEAMKTKWSLEIRHKCSCPLFFCKGQCKHVVVLAMLANPTTVLLPKKSDLEQVRLCAGKKRGRPAGNGDSDSLDEKRKKPKEKLAEKEQTLQSSLLSDSVSGHSFWVRLYLNIVVCVQDEQEREREPVEPGDRGGAAQGRTKQWVSSMQCHTQTKQTMFRTLTMSQPLQVRKSSMVKQGSS